MPARKVITEGGAADVLGSSASPFRAIVARELR
jgi:hypothetical protein